MWVSSCSKQGSLVVPGTFELEFLLVDEMVLARYDSSVDENNMESSCFSEVDVLFIVILLLLGRRWCTVLTSIWKSRKLYSFWRSLAHTYTKISLEVSPKPPNIQLNTTYTITCTRVCTITYMINYILDSHISTVNKHRQLWLGSLPAHKGTGWIAK